MKEARNRLSRWNRRVKAAAIALVAVVAWTVFGATAANAATYGSWGNCQWYNDNYICQRWVDYNWWEETFQGKRDYWQLKSFATR